jgi:type IV secretion system protein TrbL
VSALVKRRRRPVASSRFASRLAGLMALGLLLASGAASAQEGALLSELENQVLAATRDWQTTVFEAARSLFWILASIEIGLAAVWLALAAASLDTWFAELVRRILFIGFFALLLEQGPEFARAVVDSLFQIGATQGSASPAEVFDAGIRVASVLSENASFGVFEDNALAIASVIAMGVVVICFSLVAAIFVAVMVEMYVGLLAGMIMLGLGGSSFTKDFSLRYLIYAFSVGMKLMALVMIARIGSEVLLGLSSAPVSDNDSFPFMCRRSFRVWCRAPRSRRAAKRSAMAFRHQALLREAPSLRQLQDNTGLPLTVLQELQAHLLPGRYELACPPGQGKRRERWGQRRATS